MQTLPLNIRCKHLLFFTIISREKRNLLFWIFFWSTLNIYVFYLIPIIVFIKVIKSNILNIVDQKNTSISNSLNFVLMQLLYYFFYKSYRLIRSAKKNIFKTTHLINLKVYYITILVWNNFRLV